MKKLRHALMAVVLAALLGACGSGARPSATEAPPPSPIPTLSNEASIMVDDFELKLYADKTNYTTSEPIQIWATFKYTGGDKVITIGHAMDYLGFSIFQADGPLAFMGAMPTPYLTSTINRDVVYRKDYIKSIGYSSNDPYADVYRKFLEGDEVYLPPGIYKVTAEAHFDLPGLEKDGDKPEYSMPLTIAIRVTK